MLKTEYTKQFKKDYKLAQKRGLDLAKLRLVVYMLSNGEVLPDSYRDHELNNSKQYHNARECHIEPDWLLIYQIINETLILRLIRTGSHSDLFV